MEQDLIEQLRKVKEHGKFFRPKDDSDEANEEFVLEVNRLLELRQRDYVMFTDKAVVKNYKTEKDYYTIVGPVKITYKGEKMLTGISQNEAKVEVINVGIIIALEEEFQHLISELKSNYQTIRDDNTGTYFYLFERQNPQNNSVYRCIATFAGEMGSQKAASITRHMINKFNPPVLVMIGIAGGISKDIRIGDVVIPDQIDAYMDNAKALDASANNAFELMPSGNVYRASIELIHFARNLKFAHAELYNSWQETCAKEQALLLTDDTERANYVENQTLRDLAVIEVGHIASGPAVSSAKNFISWLKRRDRKFLAIEMEAAGLMAEVYEEIKQRKTLIIRGISDFGDNRKEELDDTHEGAFRSLAMRNAIRLLWTFMDASVF